MLKAMGMKLKTKNLKVSSCNNLSLFYLLDLLDLEREENLKHYHKHNNNYLIIFKDIKSDEDFNSLSCIIPFRKYTNNKKFKKINLSHSSDQYEVILLIEFNLTFNRKEFDIFKSKEKCNNYISFEDSLFFGVITKEFSLHYYSKILNVSLLSSMF